MMASPPKIPREMLEEMLDFSVNVFAHARRRREIQQLEDFGEGLSVRPQDEDLKDG